MIDYPVYSPWGEVDYCEKLCPGAYSVSTPSHGGVMVTKDVVKRFFPKEAKKHGFWAYGFLCFEEDCAAAVALRVLMDKGLYTAPVNPCYGPGEYEECINNTLIKYYKEFWQAREKGVLQIEDQEKTKEREL